MLEVERLKRSLLWLQRSSSKRLQRRQACVSLAGQPLFFLRAGGKITSGDFSQVFVRLSQDLGTTNRSCDYPHNVTFPPRISCAWLPCTGNKPELPLRDAEKFCVHVTPTSAKVTFLPSNCIPIAHENLAKVTRRYFPSRPLKKQRLACETRLV